MRDVYNYVSLKKVEEGQIVGKFTNSTYDSSEELQVNFKLCGKKKDILVLKSSMINPSQLDEKYALTEKSVSCFILFIIDFVALNRLKLNIPTSFLNQLKRLESKKSLNFYGIFKKKLVDKFMKPSPFREKEYVGDLDLIKNASVLKWYNKHVQLNMLGLQEFSSEDTRMIKQELVKGALLSLEKGLYSRVLDREFIMCDVRGMINFYNTILKNQGNLKRNALNSLYNFTSENLNTFTTEQLFAYECIKAILQRKELSRKVIFTEDTSYFSFVVTLTKNCSGVRVITSNSRYSVGSKCTIKEIISLAYAADTVAVRISSYTNLMSSDPFLEVDYEPDLIPN